MQNLPRFLLVFLLLALALRADEALAHARRAQAALGPETWTRVIRVENAARFSRYPRVVYAVVFELADILWFYTDTDGTQSFSLHKGLLAEEKADFAPLLRDVEPGFARWSVVADEAGPAAQADGELPNGCFIKSVAALRRRLAQGDPIARPALLSYYMDTPAGRRGHTVLTYEARGRLEVIDPEWPNKPRRFSAALAADALALARDLNGDRIAAARWIPLARATAPDGGLYATVGHPAAGGSG